MGYVNEVFDVDVRFAKCSSSICIGNNANKFIDFCNNAERLTKDEDEHQAQKYSCLLRCPACKGSILFKYTLTIKSI